MTDSDSDGAIPRDIRRRILQLLYSTADTQNATYSVRELAAAVGVDPRHIIGSIEQNNDLIYDRESNTVHVKHDAAPSSQYRPARGASGAAAAPTSLPEFPLAYLTKKPKHRRPLGKSSDIRSSVAAADTSTGRVGYVCVADEFLLEELESYYAEQGYYTKCDYDVLHIRFSDKELNKQKVGGGFMSSAAAATDGSKGNASGLTRRPSVGVSNTSLTTTEATSSTALRSAAATGNGAKSYGTTPTTAYGVGASFGSSPTSNGVPTMSTTVPLSVVERALAKASSHQQSGSGAIGTGSASGAAGSLSVPSGSAPARKLGFDLFVFQYGAIVWWGFDQKFFKIVEQDFMFPSSRIQKYIVNRYKTQIINEIYPVWCTYSLERKETLEPDDDFKERLLFDHFLIPFSSQDLDSASISMLCASHALAQSAKIDYLEIKIQDLTQSCKPLPRELKEFGRVTIAERRLLQLRGEVLSYRLMLKSGSDLLDEPELFWQNAYLKPIFQATKECFEISERVRALDTKLDADHEILGMIAEQFHERHGARLEWIVIWLVLVEVIIGVLELLLDVRPWMK